MSKDKNKSYEKRLEELKDFTNDQKNPLIDKLIGYTVACEKKIDNIIELPFIQYKLDDPAVQVRTEAGKEFSSLIASYISLTKTLSFLSGKTSDDKQSSPLEEYLRNANS